MTDKLNLSEVKVEKVIVHKVGNKFRDEGLILSSAESEHDSSVDSLLIQHFLLPIIDSENEYLLTHESDINLNPIKHYSSLVFKDEKEFLTSSLAIAKHLYISSDHPNIGGGEFIEVLYSGIKVDDLKIQAIGLFRIESKSSYLDVKKQNDVIDIVEKKGISIDSIQKGAVVLSSEDTVFIIDSVGKKTKYWVENFIKAVPKNTVKKYTQILSSLTKAVSKKIHLPQDFLDFSDALSKEDNLSVNQLKRISTAFVENEDFDNIVSSLGIKNSMEIDMDFVVEMQDFSKKINKTLSKTRISKGVDIVISESNLKILSIDSQITDFGLRSIIDIQRGG
ncbi:MULTISPECIES: nucleoid-associated protein [unclassified Avibacterium]|uniref:nucleoid-associated protein n=1 Tax=unclassified Avibacterium TaxID=2685287 RepID=UPI002027372C|nr:MULTISPECIES: nucleoid-associated protein [unclassified Avibacterium]MCW9699106.1 nucleoid-associated protein [Avibacterium sp. 20-129]URL06701.1 nucleoid-associated protein [Avibacterium sp. 21-595]